MADDMLSLSDWQGVIQPFARKHGYSKGVATHAAKALYWHLPQVLRAKYRYDLQTIWEAKIGDKTAELLWKFLHRD